MCVCVCVCVCVRLCERVHVCACIIPGLPLLHWKQVHMQRVSLMLLHWKQDHMQRVSLMLPKQSACEHAGM